MLLENEKIQPLGGNYNIIVSDQHTFWNDTILLANFSAPKQSENAVDLGAGCGGISLMWCKNNLAKSITAIEIQKTACDMLNRSVKLNNLENKISVINADLCDLKGILPFGVFDIVVCNPPYKATGTGIVNPSEQHKIARHETLCTIDDITKTASNLLRFSGRFCLCLRPERLCEVFESMRKNNIEPKRLQFVQQRKSKAPKLFLVEGKRGGKKGGLIVMPTLFIEDENGSYSQEMIDIYGDYL